MIDENIDTVHKKDFSPERIVRLNEKIARSRAGVMAPCTSCNYCAPCTQGIDIPRVIEIYNHYSILEGKGMFVRDYAMLPAPAECCIRCEARVEKCTQHIDIPEIMEKAARLFMRL